MTNIVDSADATESARDIKVKYLKTPDKSESDKKDYRVIQLENELTALLISDIKSLQNDESKEIGNNKDEKMAGCAVSINVGSFSDPIEVQGIAHFLEHMVFMGSEKYPEENDYFNFIGKHGGNTNAWTDNEETVFYFQIQEIHLYQAIDRLVQFFITPLMKRDAIARERQAVDSEFKLGLLSDGWRKEQLFGKLACEGHPMRNFSCGNLISLRDNIDEDTLYLELHKFRERHYSAHRMKVAVQARLPLDVLEQYVKNCFVNVPVNHLPPINFSEFVGKSFDNPDFTKLYRIKPIEDKYEVVLTWALPPLKHLYRNKPIGYIESVIGKDRKGSLINYLRNKKWLTDLWCPEHENDGVSMYNIFYLELILTDEGRKHLNDVLGAVFSYLTMLKRELPQERIFKEMQEIKKIRFRYLEDKSPAKNVTELCTNMHYYPSEHYISAQELYFEYNPDLIRDCINALAPDNVNIMIFDANFNEEEFDQIEPWYQTKYSSCEIPKEWIEYWKNIEPLPEFHLPKPNIFIADDFSLIDLPDIIPEYPTKIHFDEKMEIWYRPDPVFRLPECHVYLQFLVPSVIESPKFAAMLDMFLGSIEFLAAEELCEAGVAGLNCQFISRREAFIIKLSGRNQKLPLLLNAVLKYLVNCYQLVDEELFNTTKMKQLRSYYNFFIIPNDLVRELGDTLMTKGVYNSVQKHAALTEVVFEDFISFAEKLTKQTYIRCLVQGNISEDGVMKNVYGALQSLQYDSLLPGTYPVVRTGEIPRGVTHFKAQNFRSTDDNSAVRNYYQSGVLTIENYVIADLVMLIMSELVFDQLRTKEQLGYVAFCQAHDHHDVLAYSITVCTEAKKFTTEHVDERIECFLKTFITYLDKMSDEEFKKFKDVLIKENRRVDSALKVEVCRNWNEIVDKRYMFDRNKKKIAAIESLTFAEVRQWMVDRCFEGKSFRKLSIQISATPDADQRDSKEGDSNEGKVKYSFNYLTDENNEKKALSSHYITDIESFKNTLPISENHEISINAFSG